MNNIDKGVYEYEDLVQVGNLGLIKAAKTYNGSVKFATYASRCIVNELYMYFRKNNKHISVVSLDEIVFTDSDGKDITLADTIPSNDTTIEDIVSELDELEKCYKIILNCFSYTEAIILLYSAIGKKQTYIANKLNFSQSYVSRLETKLSKKLKKCIKNSVNYEEAFKVSVSTEGCKVSFSTKDIHGFNKAIQELLNGTILIKEFRIVRVDDKISLIIPEIENSAEIIALLVESIRNYSIVVINNNLLNDEEGWSEVTKENNISTNIVNEDTEGAGEYSDNNKYNDDEKDEEYDISQNVMSCEKTDNVKVNSIQKENDNTHIETESKSTTAVIRDYFMSLGEFSVKDIINRFPNYSRAIIASALNYSKSRGHIIPLSRGMYKVSKSK